jgi:hypothetical protein
MDKVHIEKLPLVLFLLIIIFSLVIPFAISRNTALAEEPELSEIRANMEELADLLDLVNIEYIDAVSDGKVINQDLYDESVFYTTTASETFNDIKQSLLTIAAAQTLEVENDLKKMSTLVQNKADTPQVSDTLRHAKQKLQEIFVTSGGTIDPIDGWTYIDSINELLDRLIMNYSEGSYEEARSLAREAYFDNFESIRADIAEDNKELMETIENKLRVELVDMIDDRRPTGEIESYVEQVKADLQEAKSVVTPEFSTAALVMIILMIGVLIMSRTRTISGPWHKS